MCAALSSQYIPRCTSWTSASRERHSFDCGFLYSLQRLLTTGRRANGPALSSTRAFGFAGRSPQDLLSLTVPGFTHRAIMWTWGAPLRRGTLRTTESRRAEYSSPQRCFKDEDSCNGCGPLACRIRWGYPRSHLERSRIGPSWATLFQLPDLSGVLIYDKNAG